MIAFTELTSGVAVASPVVRVDMAAAGVARAESLGLLGMASEADTIQACSCSSWSSWSPCCPSSEVAASVPSVDALLAAID
jgi:hypothetical protein